MDYFETYFFIILVFNPVGTRPSLNLYHKFLSYDRDNDVPVGKLPLYMKTESCSERHVTCKHPDNQGWFDVNDDGGARIVSTNCWSF